MDRYKTILLFGAPGSGKGTQGKIIGTIPGFMHSSTGDIFRSLDLASDVGRKFWEFAGRVHDRFVEAVREGAGVHQPVPPGARISGARRPAAKPHAEKAARRRAGS